MTKILRCVTDISLKYQLSSNHDTICWTKISNLALLSMLKLQQGEEHSLFKYVYILFLIFDVVYCLCMHNLLCVGRCAHLLHGRHMPYVRHANVHACTCHVLSLPSSTLFLLWFPPNLTLCLFPKMPSWVQVRMKILRCHWYFIKILTIRQSQHNRLDGNINLNTLFNVKTLIGWGTLSL